MIGCVKLIFIIFLINFEVDLDIKTLEDELEKLSPKEKAIITYKLLNSLEENESGDIDEIWINEAIERYSQIIYNKDILTDAASVIKEAKEKYK